jgi:hypothetical protein
MALKYINIFPSKALPNLDFWFEKKPSGNRGAQPFPPFSAHNKIKATELQMRP